MGRNLLLREVRSVSNLLRRMKSGDGLFPPIDYELEEPRRNGLLRGTVLNAGAGWRDLSHLVDGELVNQDLRYDDEKRTNIHIYSPLHVIPRPDAAFDSIICIAVLEHVENPDEVLAEFFRVLRPGGHLIASVPFMQPEHKVPTDFQRYTRDGLERTVRKAGFEIVKTDALFSTYHTLHWMAAEALALKSGIGGMLLRNTILPALYIAARHSKLQSDKIASAFRCVARR
jgi:SAM-dependent methyltransferase